VAYTIVLQNRSNGITNYGTWVYEKTDPSQSAPA